MNSLTSIVTFLMVFIIQSSQNRDNMAMRAKLDAQNQVLGAIGQTLGVGDLQKLLELMALEEAPEKGIHDERRHVQHPHLNRLAAATARQPDSRMSGWRQSTGPSAESDGTSPSPR